MFNDEITRRQLISDLTKLTGLFLPLSGCVKLQQNSEFAEVLVKDKPINQLSSILQSLIATFIPLDEPIFKSLPYSYFEQLIVVEFDVYNKPEFLFYKRMLVAFNKVDLFVYYPNELLRIGNESTPITKKELDIDKKSYLEWSKGKGQFTKFTMLSNRQKHDYLMLWSQSPLNYKRTFYKVCKSLIFASIYSQEQFTVELGYRGPLLLEKGL